MASWLSDASANRHIKTYVKDFLDLSGNLTVRNTNGYDWNNYGQVLSGNYEGDDNVFFGIGVGMDVSGLTIVVGANRQDGNNISNGGAVTVYRYDTTAGIWYQLGNLITGESNNNEFGYDVDINDAGTRIMATDADANFVNVYDYNSGTNTWDKQLNLTTSADGIDVDRYAGRISGDGNTIVFSAYANNNYTGKQYVYRNTSGTTWTKIAEFTGSHAQAYGGIGPSISYDGNRMAFCEKDYNFDANGNSVEDLGRIGIYDYSGIGATWNLVGDHIYGENTGDRAMDSSDFSKDGSIVAFASDYMSYIKVYQYDAIVTGSWKQLGTIIKLPSNAVATGGAPRLSDDGTVLLVSQAGDDTAGANNGALYIYKYINGDWVKQGSTLYGLYTGSQLGTSYGGGTAMSGDGSKIVAGGIYADVNDGDSGYVQAFQWSQKAYEKPIMDISGGTMTVWGGAEENPDNWDVTNVTEFSDGTAQYGSDIEFNANGTIMVVGEYGYDSNSGRIHVYQYRNGIWSKMGSDVADSIIGHEGFSVSMNDSGLIIGSGGLSAIAIVWEFINGDWSVKGGEIVNNNISSLGHRGSSLNGEGNIVAWIGNDGAAIYQYNSGTDSWDQLGSDFTGLTHNDGRKCISLNQAGNIVAFGDPGYDSPSTDAGRVGIFQYNSGTNSWDQLGDWITAPSTTSGGSGDHYGQTVSLSSDGYIVAFGTTIGTGATADFHARIFQYVPSVGQWMPRSPDVQNDHVTTAAGSGAYVGNFVALSGDGNTLIVNDQNAQTVSGVYGGAVHVLKYINGMYKWVTRLDGPTAVSYYLGADAVAISRDGTRVGGSRLQSNFVRIGDIVNVPALTIEEDGSMTMGRSMTIQEDGKIGMGSTNIFSAYSNAVNIDAVNTASNDALGVRSSNDAYNIINFFNISDAYRGGIAGVNSSSIQYLTTSDRRLKTDITTLQDGLAKVMKLKPRSYRWKENGELADGFVSQEVFEVFPHFIPNSRFKCDISQNEVYHGELCSCCNIETKSTGEDFIFGLDYSTFTPYLCKAIQEQQTLIEAEKTKTSSLETQMADVLSRLSALESA